MSNPSLHRPRRPFQARDRQFAEMNVSAAIAPRPFPARSPTPLTLSQSTDCIARRQTFNVFLTNDVGVDPMRGLIGSLAALSLIASATFALARDRVASLGPMPRPATVSLPSGLANAPIGWTQFCGANASECEVEALAPERITLTRASWAIISRINKTVNDTIEQVEDLDHFGVVEFWTYPVDGKGDCEDLVLLKRRQLIEAGMPRQALLITVVRDEQGAGHAVLTVRTDRGDYVLDNKTDKILGWRSTGYSFVKRQSQENPSVWVSIGEPGSGVTITAGNLPH